MRKLLALAGQTDHRQHLANPGATRLVRAGAQTEGDIVGDRQMREQRIVLEHHADVPLLDRHVDGGAGHQFAIEDDFAGRDRLEAGNATQHRGFAAAGGAEQAADAAPFEAEGDAIEYRLAGVGAGDVGQFEEGHRTGHRACIAHLAAARGRRIAIHGRGACGRMGGGHEQLFRPG